MVAAAGKKSAELAGRIGDGLIATEPDDTLVKRFTAAGGKAKPRYAELIVCWAKDEAARRGRLRPCLCSPGGTRPGGLRSSGRTRFFCCAHRARHSGATSVRDRAKGAA
jgi:hypothetical protein